RSRRYQRTRRTVEGVSPAPRRRLPNHLCLQNLREASHHPMHLRGATERGLRNFSAASSKAFARRREGLKIGRTLADPATRSFPPLRSDRLALPDEADRHWIAVSETLKN